MQIDVTRLNLVEVELLIERLSKMGLKTKLKRFGEKLSLVTDNAKLPTFESPMELDFISF